MAGEVRLIVEADGGGHLGGPGALEQQAGVADAGVVDGGAGQREGKEPVVQVDSTTGRSISG